MRRMPIPARIAPFLTPGCPGMMYAGLARLSPGCPPGRGRLHTCYSPVRRSPAESASTLPAAPRLACVKPAASVHPEPGSNSTLSVYIFQYIRYLVRPRPSSQSPRGEGSLRPDRPQSPLRLTETNVSFPRRPPRSGRRRSLLVLSHSVNVLPQTLAFPPFASAKLLPPARSRKYFRNLFPLCRAAAHATR